MSQLFLEREFPLDSHPAAYRLRSFVVDSLYSENVNPTAKSQWDDEAIIYVRSSWASISDRMADEKIELSSDEEVRLMGFSSEYASLVDDEDSMAELVQLRKEGDDNE